MIARKLIAATMTVAACAATTSSAATIVFSEDFESYADSAALRLAWTGSTTTAFNLNNTGYDPSPTPLATQTGVTNLGRFVSGQSAFKTIPTPIAASTNFSAQVDVLAETYARSLGFAITNAAGTQGYIVQWNNAAVNNNSGRGLVSIAEYNSATPLSGAVFGTMLSGTRPIYAIDSGTGLPTGSPTGTSTGTTTNSYHPALGYRVTNAPSSDASAATYDSTFRGLLTLTLEYEAPTTVGGPATLRLFTDGSDNPNPTTVAVMTVSDSTPFTGINFERFYVMGTSANFDNIAVSVVPEPATMGLLALGGCMLFRRRRV